MQRATNRASQQGLHVRTSRTHSKATLWHNMWFAKWLWKDKWDLNIHMHTPAQLPVPAARHRREPAHSHCQCSQAGITGSLTVHTGSKSALSLPIQLNVPSEKAENTTTASLGEISVRSYWVPALCHTEIGTWHHLCSTEKLMAWPLLLKPKYYNPKSNQQAWENTTQKTSECFKPCGLDPLSNVCSEFDIQPKWDQIRQRNPQMHCKLQWNYYMSTVKRCIIKRTELRGSHIAYE